MREQYHELRWSCQARARGYGVHIILLVHQLVASRCTEIPRSRNNKTNRIEKIISLPYYNTFCDREIIIIVGCFFLDDNIINTKKIIILLLPRV